MKIQLGEVIVHPDVEHALGQCGQHVREFVDRFEAADFGDIDAEIDEFNKQAIQVGDDILGVYETCSGAVIWIISDGKTTEVFIP